jgi:tRNA U34 2-thiouridine synthase MnmA/TrmU
MKHWEGDHASSSKVDLVNAAAVVAVVGVDIELMNFVEYCERVFVDCLHDYPASRSPNSDILGKTEVRRLIAQIGLPNAADLDRSDICFIGGDLADRRRARP